MAAASTPCRGARRGGLLLLAAVGLALLAGAASPSAFMGPPAPREKDARTSAAAGPSKDPRAALPTPEDEARWRTAAFMMNLASFAFWAVFVKLVVVEDHYVAPLKLREAMTVQGLGGGVMPLFPQN